MKIENKFFDLIIYVLSMIFSFFRSFMLLFGFKKEIKRWIFFKSLDFVFRWWPDYFWKKPNLFKIGMFLWLFIKHVFYNKKDK